MMGDWYGVFGCVMLRPAILTTTNTNSSVADLPQRWLQEPFQSNNVPQPRCEYAHINGGSGSETDDYLSAYTQKAIGIVQRAIEEDTKQNYPEAYKQYSNALDYFMLALRCTTYNIAFGIVK